MAANDRKRRILDHLTKSADGVKYITPQKPTTTNQPIPTPEIVNPATTKTKKRRVMEHLSQSSQEFGDFSLNADDEIRNQQIQNHIRKSLG